LPSSTIDDAPRSRCRREPAECPIHPFLNSTIYNGGQSQHRRQRTGCRSYAISRRERIPRHKRDRTRYRS
jgi:hypothetical protein